MKNPRPIKRALRLERRRAELGSDNPRCFYCPESAIERLEVEHPVGRKHDPHFKRAVCRNCHRTLELKRDLAGLTKNGQHDTQESEIEELRSYLLLLAEDQDSIAERLQSQAASPSLVAAALRSTAESLRRRAKSLSHSSLTTTPVTVGTEAANSVGDHGQPHAHR